MNKESKKVRSTMRKFLSVLVFIGVIFLLTACGGVKNETSLEAAQTIMKGMVKGDSELIEEINHSSDWSFPTHYMISIANKRNLIGADLKSMEYEVDEEDERIVTVQYINTEGNEKSITMQFNEESDGYYFIKLGKN